MGVWGISLYENDIGSDVRAYFEAQLRNGKSGSTITQELVEQYQDALADPEDAPAFWIALADTQWDLGRLEKGVKDKALLYLEYGESPLNGLSRPSSSEKAETDYLSALKENCCHPRPSRSASARSLCIFVRGKTGMSSHTNCRDKRRQRTT